MDILCLKAQMPATCLLNTSAFPNVMKSRNALLSGLLELNYVELGIWFQMIALTHAYALHKHEKAR